MSDRRAASCVRMQFPATTAKLARACRPTAPPSGLDILGESIFRHTGRLLACVQAYALLSVGYVTHIEVPDLATALTQRRCDVGVIGELMD